MDPQDSTDYLDDMEMATQCAIDMLKEGNSSEAIDVLTCINSLISSVRKSVDELQSEILDLKIQNMKKQTVIHQMKKILSNED